MQKTQGFALSLINKGGGAPKQNNNNNLATLSFLSNTKDAFCFYLYTHIYVGTFRDEKMMSDALLLALLVIVSCLIQGLGTNLNLL